MQPVDLDGQRLGLQPIPGASGAGRSRHIALDLLARPGTVGFLPAPLQIGNDAFETLDRFVGAGAILILELDLLVGAAQDRLPTRFRQIAPPAGQLEAEGLAKRFERLIVIGRGGLSPRGNRAVFQRARRLRDDQRFVNLLLRAETIAGRACAERIVIGKQPRFDFRNGEAGYGAGEFFRKQHAFMRFVQGLVRRSAGSCVFGWKRLIGKLGDCQTIG